MDTTNRYDNEFPDRDMFEQIVRDAEEAEREKECTKVTLTDEQKERMMRNRELAKQRQLEKKLEKQKLADEENTLGATTSEQNQIENPTVPHSTVSKNPPPKNANTYFFSRAASNGPIWNCNIISFFYRLF